MFYTKVSCLLGQHLLNSGGGFRWKGVMFTGLYVCFTFFFWSMCIDKVCNCWTWPKKKVFKFCWLSGFESTFPWMHAPTEIFILLLLTRLPHSKCFNVIAHRWQYSCCSVSCEQQLKFFLNVSFRQMCKLDATLVKSFQWTVSIWLRLCTLALCDICIWFYWTFFVAMWFSTWLLVFVLLCFWLRAHAAGFLVWYNSIKSVVIFWSGAISFWYVLYNVLRVPRP